MEKFIDIGIDHSIPYHGKKQIDKRAIVKLDTQIFQFMI